MSIPPNNYALSNRLGSGSFRASVGFQSTFGGGTQSTLGTTHTLGNSILNRQTGFAAAGSNPLFGGRSAGAMALFNHTAAMQDREMTDSEFMRQQVIGHLQEDRQARGRIQELFLQRLRMVSALHTQIEGAVQRIVAKCIEIDDEVSRLNTIVVALKARPSPRDPQERQDWQAEVDLREKHVFSQLELGKSLKGGLQDTFVLTYNSIEKAQGKITTDFQDGLNSLLEARLKDIENFAALSRIITEHKNEDCKHLIQLHDQVLKEDAQRMQSLLDAHKVADDIRHRQQEFDLKRWTVEREQSLKQQKANLEAWQVQLAHGETTLKIINAHAEEMTKLHHAHQIAMR